MSRLTSLRRPGSLPLLALLAAWATLLSLEVWVRQPGPLLSPPLPPPQLQLDGLIYRRGAPLPIREPEKTLSSGASAVRRWDVPYSAVGAAAGAAPPRFRLVQIQGSGTGRAERLQVEKILRWQGDKGRPAGSCGCLVRDVQGQVQLLIYGSEWDRWHDNRRLPPQPWRRLGWILGLRPIEQVDCLWLSSGGGPFSRRALSDLAAGLGAAVPDSGAAAPARDRLRAR